MISTNNLDTLLQEGMAKGNEELKRLQKEWKEIEKEEKVTKKVSFADNQMESNVSTKRDCSPSADQALSCTSSRSSSEDEEGLCLRFMERYSSVILRMDEILRKEMRKANVEFERLRKDWKRMEKKKKLKT